MKTVLIAAASAAVMTSGVMAADFGVMTQPAPMAYAAPAADWTGFYAGAFGGIGGADFNLVPVGIPGAGLLTTGRGGLAGVAVGADYQLDSFVVGAVADIALTNVEGTATISAGGGSVTYNSRLDYLGTLRARAGFLPTDSLLIYAHGGFAYGRSTPTLSANGVNAPGFVATNRTGWTIGAGAEFAVTENVSVLTEYAYTDLGNPTVTDASAPGQATESLKMHTLKAGLNFRF